MINLKNKNDKLEITMDLFYYNNSNESINTCQFKTILTFREPVFN